MKSPPPIATTATPKQPQNDQHGIVCRACGCRHFFVIYTRRAFGGKVIRRRECRNCGRRITTSEIRIG